MDELVKKLSTGKHPVKLEPRTEKLSELKERFNEGYVFVKFTKTRGGTELGINIDNTRTNLKNADFEKGIGLLQINGTCELNFHEVCCIAEIDLKTREGFAYLEVIKETENV